MKVELITSVPDDNIAAPALPLPPLAVLFINVLFTNDLTVAPLVRYIPPPFDALQFVIVLFSIIKSLPLSLLYIAPPSPVLEQLSKVQFAIVIF